VGTDGPEGPERVAGRSRRRSRWWLLAGPACCRTAEPARRPWD